VWFNQNTNTVVINPGAIMNNGDPFTITNVLGTTLGSGTYNATAGNTVALSSAVAPGAKIWFNYNGDVHGVTGGAPLSITLRIANGANTPTVVGASGTNNTLTVNWFAPPPGTVNEVGPAGNYTIWDTTNSTQVGTATAVAGSPGATLTLTLTPTNPNINGGNTLVTGTNYNLRVAANTVQATANGFPNTAQVFNFTAGTGTPTITVSTGPTSGSTSQNPPTWTGTATTPNSGATISGGGIKASIDSGAFSATGVTITSGSGTNNVSWSFTPTAPLTNASHTIQFEATDSVPRSGFTGVFTFSETGPPALVSGATNIGAKTIVATFNQPVDCSTSTVAEWSFTDNYTGPAKAGPSNPATAVAGGPGATQCTITFTNTGGNFTNEDFGPLSYTPPVAGGQVQNSADTANAVGGSVTVPATAQPIMTSDANAHTTTVTVTYNVAILCTSVTTGNYSVTVNGVADAVTAVTCPGTGGSNAGGNSTTVDLTITTAPTAGANVTVHSGGGVTDQFGTHETATSVSALAT